jgi:thiamine kinase-like enzyme
MLNDLVSKYFPCKDVANLMPFGNGHINDTFLLEVFGVPQGFILQRINTNVFKDPQGIVDTHLKLQKHISGKQDQLTIAEIIPNSKGDFLTIDNEGKAWRLTDFIKNSYTIDVVEKCWQAFEAGSAYGWFAKTCSSLNPNDFKESIKDFHRLSFRLGQLNDAIASNRAGRLNSVRDIVDFFKQREKKLSKIEHLVDEGKIPLRVVHNDTKINNLLFRGEKAVAVIDLDTVGSGIIYNDYGDALRTSASTAKEDEKDLSKVKFSIESFKSFTEGYMDQVRSVVTDAEMEYFYLAPVLLTYIMGIRFLADYLNGDKYYKIAYKEHNIDRCKVQMKLIESMESYEAEMISIIKNCLKNALVR